MSRPHPAPVIPLSNRLLLAITEVTASFPVKHRHQSGALLRAAAEECALLAARAWRVGGEDKPLQSTLLYELRLANEALKLRLQICYRLQCFRSAERFAEIAKLAREVGRQAKAWKTYSRSLPFWAYRKSHVREDGGMASAIEFSSSSL